MGFPDIRTRVCVALSTILMALIIYKRWSLLYFIKRNEKTTYDKEEKQKKSSEADRVTAGVRGPDGGTWIVCFVSRSRSLEVRPCGDCAELQLQRRARAKTAGWPAGEGDGSGPLRGPDGPAGEKKKGKEQRLARRERME